MRATQRVFRIEAAGEEPVPFPSLQDATRSDPTHAEAVIATSPDGVVLAEATPWQAGHGWPVAQYVWRPTVAGHDVLWGVVVGLERAS